jgi:hypothetical protein
MLISNHLECQKCGHLEKDVSYESGKIPRCAATRSDTLRATDKPGKTGSTRARKTKSTSRACGGKRIVVWMDTAPHFSL